MAQTNDMHLHKSFRVALLSLALAVVGFAWLSFFKPHDFRSAAPLPRPGLDVRFSAKGSEIYPFVLRVEVPAASSERENFLSGVASTYSCIIALSKIDDGPPVQLVRSELRSSATYEWGHSVIYTSPRFNLPDGLHILELRNDGCRDSIAFRGGTATVQRSGPVRFSIPCIELASYALTLIGLAALGVAAISYRSTARR